MLYINLLINNFHYRTKTLIHCFDRASCHIPSIRIFFLRSYHTQIIFGLSFLQNQYFCYILLPSFHQICLIHLYYKLDHFKYSCHNWTKTEILSSFKTGSYEEMLFYYSFYISLCFRIIIPND